MPLVNPGRLPGKVTLESLQAQLDILNKAVSGGIDIGHPLQNDPSAVEILAGGGGGTGSNFHNGEQVNMAVSYVTAILTAEGTNTYKCFHNLYLDNPLYTVPETDKPNVRWFAMSVWHGTTSGGNSGQSVKVNIAYLRRTSGLVNANDITLVFFINALGSLPIGAAPNQVFVDLAFIRATTGE